MWRTSISLLFLLSAVQLSLGEGRFLQQDIASQFLTEPRTVRVYLPPSYEREPHRRYPVLYLHDGQNVFSSAGTNICWFHEGGRWRRVRDAAPAQGALQRNFGPRSENDGAFNNI